MAVKFSFAFLSEYAWHPGKIQPVLKNFSNPEKFFSKIPLQI